MGAHKDKGCGVGPIENAYVKGPEFCAKFLRPSLHMTPSSQVIAYSVSTSSVQPLNCLNLRICRGPKRLSYPVLTKKGTNKSHTHKK